MTTLLFLSYAGVEAFCNFVVTGIVWTIIIRSSALLSYLLITFTLLQYPLYFRVCLGELGKAATTHPCEHEVAEHALHRAARESHQCCAQQDHNVTP